MDFKKGPFTMAASAGVRVVPVSIVGTHLFQPPSSVLPMAAARRAHRRPPAARRAGEEEGGRDDGGDEGRRALRPPPLDAAARAGHGAARNFCKRLGLFVRFTRSEKFRRDRRESPRPTVEAPSVEFMSSATPSRGRASWLGSSKSAVRDGTHESKAEDGGGATAPAARRRQARRRRCGASARRRRAGGVGGGDGGEGGVGRPR